MSKMHFLISPITFQSIACKEFIYLCLKNILSFPLSIFWEKKLSAHLHLTFVTPIFQTVSIVLDNSARRSIHSRSILRIINVLVNALLILLNFNISFACLTFQNKAIRKGFNLKLTPFNHYASPYLNLFWRFRLWSHHFIILDRVPDALLISLWFKWSTRANK